MKLFLTVCEDCVVIQARAEGTGIVGDMVQRIFPGETVLGLSYEALRALGNGAHDIETKGTRPRATEDPVG
jgi:hypothetical protein